VLSLCSNSSDVDFEFSPGWHFRCLAFTSSIFISQLAAPRKKLHVLSSSVLTVTPKLLCNTECCVVMSVKIDCVAAFLLTGDLFVMRNVCWCCCCHRQCHHHHHHHHRYQFIMIWLLFKEDWSLSSHFLFIILLKTFILYCTY